MPDTSKICSLCGIEVKQLSDHIRNFHGERETPCEICNKVFKSVMLKVRHANKTHGNASSCLLCDLTFHHIHMACVLMEICGKFLYHTPTTRPATAKRLEEMMRFKM